MIRTSFTELVGVDHPVVCAGMGSGIANGELAGRVSEAGGLGVIGASFLEPEQVQQHVAQARAISVKPLGINLLLFENEPLLDGVLDASPAVLSTAWPRDDQDLHSIFARAHDRGCRVMHMVPTLADAERAADAGADVVVAQGTEGGGHVGLMGTSVIVRQVVKALDEGEQQDVPDYWRMWVGQCAGLVDDVRPAAEVVRLLVADAEDILRTRLQSLLC